MSIFNPDLVIQIAESLGITLKEEVAKVLIQDAEYRTREIIHESAKFMKHSHRNKLLPSDINSALGVKNIQPLYGYSQQKQFKHINDLYYYEDEELDLEEIINEPLPSIPLDQTFTAHWLAIEGVQPRIVQNPTDQTQKRVVNVKKEKKEEEKVKISQVLTKELELYYDKITTCILAETKYKQLALESIRNDPGIQSLLPYFVQFIYNTVLENFKSPTMNVLKSMALMMEALLGNTYLFMEPYVFYI
jgi:transcription initiation factor TFIID subunit 6